MKNFTKKLLIASSVLICGALIHFSNIKPQLTITPAPIVAQSNVAVSAPKVTVHIAGAVYKPGVYDVTVNTRTLAALHLAGGITPGANLDKVNLAKIVKDGQRIYVPFQTASKQKNQLISAKFNLNTATAVQLQRIAGVGPALAAEIIQHRNKNGPFQNWNQLLDVKYIGPKMLEKIKPYVTLAP